jgi:hypothetical protein
MSLDISGVVTGIDGFVAHAAKQSEIGLRAGAADAQAYMRGVGPHGETGATRAGSAAYVVTPADSGSSALGAAVSAVEARRPGASATSSGSLPPGSIGVIITVPTSYQAQLEVDNAGASAVLTPTLNAHADALTRRAANGG